MFIVAKIQIHTPPNAVTEMGDSITNKPEEMGDSITNNPEEMIGKREMKKILGHIRSIEGSINHRPGVHNEFRVIIARNDTLPPFVSSSPSP